MLVFLLQFTLDQMNESKIAIVNDCVYTAKEEAKQLGGFTSAIQGNLKQKLATALGISENEIVITTNANEKTPIKRMTSASAISTNDWKQKLIHYTVSVPIGKLMAGTEFFGIRDDNTFVYTIDAYTASELID